MKTRFATVAALAAALFVTNAPAIADELKNPSSYQLSISQLGHRIYRGTVAREAAIQFSSVQLTSPSQVSLYKRIPAESNDGGWIGQVLMSLAPVQANSKPHYAYCQVAGVNMVRFTIRVGLKGQETQSAPIAVKNNLAISPPFTFHETEPTYVRLVSMDPVSPPLSSAMKQTWSFTNCTIGGALF